MPPERRTLRTAPHEWSVLDHGDGPVLLCLHGAGATADSFTDLIAEIGGGYRFFAPDLPGHGGTRMGACRRSGLREMAEDLTSLVQAEVGEVHAILGHSAGAAIALMLDRALAPRGHILINAALESFDGIAAHAFPWLARGLGALPFGADAIAALVGRDQSVRRLLAENGVDPAGPAFARYAALARSRRHIRGTLDMMAQWDLAPLRQSLGDIASPVCLIAGREDRVVPPAVSRRASRSLQHAHLIEIGGGHLVHEAAPASVASALRPFLDGLGSNRDRPR